MTVWPFSLSWEEQWRQGSNLFETLSLSYFFEIAQIILNSYTQNLIYPFPPCSQACFVPKGKKPKPLRKPVPVYFISLLLYNIFLRRWRCWGTHNYLWNKPFEGVIDTLAWLYVSLLTMLLKGFSSARLHSNSRQVAKGAYQWVTE